MRAEAAAALSALAGSGLPAAALLLAASAAAGASSTAARRCPRARAAAFEFIASLAEEGRLCGIVDGEGSSGEGGAAALKAAVASAASAAAAASSCSARSSEEGCERTSSPFPLTSAASVSASVSASARRCLASLVRCVAGSKEALASYLERGAPPAERSALLPLAESLLQGSPSAPAAAAAAATPGERAAATERGEEGAARLLGAMRLNDDEAEVEEGDGDHADAAAGDGGEQEQPPQQPRLRLEEPGKVEAALQSLRVATGREAEGASPSSSPPPRRLAECLGVVKELAAAPPPSSPASSTLWDAPSILEALATAASALLSSGDPRAREAAAGVVRAFASTRPEVLLLPSATSSSSSSSSSSSPEKKLLLEALVPRLAVAAGLDDDARVRAASWDALEEACSRCPSFEPASRALSSALRFVAGDGGDETEDRGDASAAAVAVLRAAEAATLSVGDPGPSLFRVAVATGLFGAAREATGAADAAVRMAAVRFLAALWRRSEGEGGGQGEKSEGGGEGPFYSSPSPSQRSRAIENALPRATAELVRLYASRKGY